MRRQTEMKGSLILICSILLCSFKGIAANADAGLKTIKDANGGTITYGKVEGQTTEAGAMAAILRSIRGIWGNEPQVGNFFRVRNTNSVAVFLNGVNHAKGDAQLAGLVIVSQVSPDRVEGALLYNNFQQFGSTINAMLGELFKEWHPTAASQGSAEFTGSAPVAPMQQFVLPDRSASVSLPVGWQVTPTSGMGTIFANGPNGEKVSLGVAALVGNINDPTVARNRQFGMGAGRNTVYGQGLYYPYGADMAKTFSDLNQMYRQKHGVSPAVIQIASETSLSAPPGWRQAYLTGHVDAQDGFGMKEMNTTFTCGPLGRFGNFMTFSNHAEVPVRLADQERETMIAILASFSVNQQVVANQASAIAAPEIARIHEIGKRAAQQAAASHAASDAHNAAVERHWDSIDRQGKGFSDYLLDQSVVADTKNNTHTTVWNQTADALVRSDPSRYELVPNMGLQKGVDF